MDVLSANRCSAHRIAFAAAAVSVIGEKSDQGEKTSWFILVKSTDCPTSFAELGLVSSHPAEVTPILAVGRSGSFGTCISCNHFIFRQIIVPEFLVLKNIAPISEKNTDMKRGVLGGRAGRCEDVA